MNLLTVILFVLIHQCLGERQPFCPNNGEAKLNIKCLPGQNDHNVCGEGYSCFFSGLNYHCCPSNEESKDDHQSGECPDYTFAVLDSDGKPVRCSTLGNECPGANTYCNENSPVSICCQNLKADNQPKNQEKQQELQAVEDFFNTDEEPHQSTTIKQEESPEVNSECPRDSLTVLNEDGDPSYCKSENDCPQSSMTCYGSGRKICCESIGTIGGEKHTTNILNIRPNSTHSVQTTTSQSTSQSTTAKQSESNYGSTNTQASNPASNSLPTLTSITTKQAVDKNTKIGLSEAVYKKQNSTDKIPVKEEKPKVFASKTAAFDENAKPIKYKPHNAGGYAVSQNIKHDAGEIDKKEIVQQYLLEQIKNGWPYDEKFYRSENTEVIQNGHRPSAIVHFP